MSGNLTSAGSSTSCTINASQRDLGVELLQAEVDYGFLVQSSSGLRLIPRQGKIPWRREIKDDRRKSTATIAKKTRTGTPGKHQINQSLPIQPLSVCLSLCNKELSDEAFRARLFLTLLYGLFRVNEMRRSGLNENCGKILPSAMASQYLEVMGRDSQIVRRSIPCYLVLITTLILICSATKAANKELERIDAVFNSYANASSGLIDPEGIERLCSDLEVDHTDVRVLMLAWKMKAEKQGYFTLEEWRVGLKALRVDNVSKLKKALPELEKEVRRPSNFVDFYSYAFRYCLTEEKQKSIDIDSICELLNIVLGSQYHSQVDLFTQYLKIQNDYKVINMDQWMGFYRFCDEISFPDLSNYNPELAWPLILDNFVEWIREKQSQS
ncbi:hypothetical protein ACFX1R_026872 [Malus domestica]